MQTSVDGIAIAVEIYLSHTALSYSDFLVLVEMADVKLVGDVKQFTTVLVHQCHIDMRLNLLENIGQASHRHFALLDRATMAASLRLSAANAGLRVNG
jgi:hypothetical protein